MYTRLRYKGKGGEGGDAGRISCKDSIHMRIQGREGERGEGEERKFIATKSTSLTMVITSQLL